VQSARVAARRAQCINNLKQIGLALHNYLAASGSFPMANTIAYSDPGVQTTWGTWSCHALMLGYIDNQPLYNAANFSWNCWYDVGYNIKSTVFNARINSFLCPSDSKAGPLNRNFNTIVPPTSQTYPWGGCRLDCAGCGFEFGQYENATSNHPGGSNVLFADGSVTFIKSTIAMPTWWALGTKDGGEVVTSGSY